MRVIRPVAQVRQVKFVRLERAHHVPQGFLAHKLHAFGFRVKADADVMNLARRENVKISIYDIIYQLLDDLTAALSGLLEPEIIETEIAALPSRTREIFELSRKENLSHKEIAAQLGISEQTVKKQVQNALKVIKPKLNDLGVSIAFLLLLR